MTILEQRYYECFIRLASSLPGELTDLNKNLTALNENLVKLLENAQSLSQ